MGNSLYIDEKLRNKIANAALICSILIPLLHIPCFVQLGSWQSVLINGILKNRVASLAVPMFFVISGHLFACRFGDKSWYVRQLLSRLKSLGIPYLFWNAMFFTTVLLAEGIQGAGKYSVWNFPDIWGVDFMNPSALASLWYVRCLLVFAVFSFIFRIFAKSCAGGG